MSTFAEAAEPTDADLVAGVLAGDREAFAAVYDRYADRLHDFCAAVLRDPHEAADAVQDTFVLVAERLTQLNDPARLRPWLYAVARSVALRRTRARKRVVLDIEGNDRADPHHGPAREAELASLRELVWGAAAGLSDRDRALLDLHLRQGLEGAELGEAMGVSASHAYVLLNRLRDQVERSLGALLIARLGRRDCPELDGLLTGWDGRFSPLLRKRVARHVERCTVCGRRKRAMVSPWALLAGVPLLPAPLYLRDQVLRRVELVAHRGPAPTATGPLPPRHRSRLLYAAAAAAVLLLLGLGGVGAMALWSDGDTVDTAGTPVARNLAPATTSVVTTTPSPVALPSAPALTTTTTATPRPTTTTTRPRTAPTLGQPTFGPPTTTTTAAPPPPPRDTTPPQILRQGTAHSMIWDFCDPRATTAFASITDDTGVASATLSWTDPNGKPGSRTMTLANNTWQAALGPFPLGNVTWRVTATDAVGNTTTGSPGSLAVRTCQIG